MKQFALMLLPFLVLACASQKSTKDTITGKHTIESQCPTQGTCNLEVLKDKSLVIKNDNFGRPYYATQDAPGKLVVRYTYTKKKNPLYQDDIYSEEVVFETDNTLSNIKKEAAFTDVNLLFGVQCFCRGKAGYYRPQKGSVSYTKHHLTIKLPGDIIDNQLTKTITIAFN